MDIEDLYRAARNAGMLTPVIFGDKVTYCAFRSPDTDLLDGLALSADPEIHYPASQLALSAGDIVEINGTRYQVGHVRAIRDGSECRATLSSAREAATP